MRRSAGRKSPLEFPFASLAPFARLLGVGVALGGVALAGTPPARAAERASLASPADAPSAVSAPNYSGKKAAKPWPLWTMQALPPGATAELAADETLVQMDVEPRGGFLVMAVRPSASASAGLRLWTFKAPPVALESAELRERTVLSLTFSAFDGTLFVASAARGATAAGNFAIDRFAVDVANKRLKKVAHVYDSPLPLGNLVTGLVAYDGQERVYFALTPKPGRSQILSVRGDGSGVYEVTSPKGAPGALTEEALRGAREEGLVQAPHTARVDSAVPSSLGPEGTLIWREGAGALEGRGTLKERSYDGNWGNVVSVRGGGPDVDEVWLANGYFRQRWTRGQAGFELVNRTHGRAERVAADVVFASRPLVTASGRSFVGEVRTPAGTSKLTTFAMPLRAAAVRVHRAAWGTKESALRLERDGIFLRPTDVEQLYDVYDSLAYQDLGCGEHGAQYQPVFASLDGFFEVLNAGFEAVFMLAEQKASRPALADLLKELGRVGKAPGMGRLGAIASATTKVLAGNLKHPEGALIKAGKSARSTLPIDDGAAEIDYADFRPRGPYVASKALGNYFQAFKLLNKLTLGAEERAALAADAGFMNALRRWVDVQRPFLAGTRRPTLFDVGAKPSEVPAECLPARVRSEPPLLFPLAWSLDSEILEGSVMRSGVAASCGSVAGRDLPSGLDLMAGLGSAKAKELSAAELARFPGLAESHASAEKRSAVLAQASSFVDKYLRMMQLLGAETTAPEAVTPDLWQRRLLQTALGAWVGLRHTLVLVSEQGAAECGDDSEIFELLQPEPARGAVDPLPAAWRQVGALLDLLATHARSQRVLEGLASLLHEEAEIARHFGAMAERQMRQEALTADEYKLLETFGGAVEHPYLLFKSVLKHGDASEIPVPEPMPKIVDIQRGAEGTVWHAAVGKPLEAPVLLGDRGVLVPATGAVYSFYEVTAPRALDDKEWRERLGETKRPAWVEPLLQAKPTGKPAPTP